MNQEDENRYGAGSSLQVSMSFDSFSKINLSEIETISNASYFV